MTYLYKLTDLDGYTQRGKRHQTLWAVGTWVEVLWSGRLCRQGCLHAYRDPLLAVLMDPVHAGLLPNAKLWVAEGNVRDEDASKVGCDRLRVLCEHELPELTRAQRVRWAIYCALEVYADGGWLRWAEGWLEGRCRYGVDAFGVAARADAFARGAMAANGTSASCTAAIAAAGAAYAAARHDHADLGSLDVADHAASAAQAAQDAASVKVGIDLLRLALRAIAEEPDDA